MTFEERWMLLRHIINASLKKVIETGEVSETVNLKINMLAVILTAMDELEVK